jgi:curved DNA-binding protein
VSQYKDYYKTLGVGKSATEDEIKAAYRKLAKEFHPDRNKGDPAAEAKFKEINEAYEALGDTEKRKIYDDYGSSGGFPGGFPGRGGFRGGNPGDAGDFSDFFSSLFGGGFSQGTTGTRGTRGGARVNTSPFGDVFSDQRAPVRDVEGTVRIALQEGFHGTTRTVEVGGKRLEVAIPRGTKDGTKLRLNGQAPGGGNVMLTVKLEGDPNIKLEGDDVRILTEVPAPIAVVGGKITATTLEGRGEVNIPARSQPGRVLRLRGQGWVKRDGSRGDALLEIRIAVPKEPTAEELELYEKLAKITA